MSLIALDCSKLCSVVDRAINCRTNNNLINVINPKIDGILPLVPKVESLIKQIENLSSQLTAKFAELPEDFQKSKMTENTQQLKHTAEAVIITASTIIRSQSTIVGGQDRQQPSSSSSGHFPEALRNSFVEEWISQLTIDQGEMRLESDIISELMPDDSVSCVARNKQSQEIDEVGMPGSSPDTTQNESCPTSTGRENLENTVLDEESVHLNSSDETSSSSEYLNSDTVSAKTLTAYREDPGVYASYNEKSAKELLTILGTDPEAKGWKVNDSLFDVARMKAGSGLRSSSNIVGTLAYLLEKGGDVNSKNANSCTPLHFASQEGNTVVVELLVERNADTNMNDKYGWTALHNAARRGHTPVVEILLIGGADIECETERHPTTSLRLAASAGRESTVECLLKAGASMDARTIGGDTPLHSSSRWGHVGVVKKLLKGGALTESRNKYGDTPLHIASSRGHIGVIEALLKAGALIDTRSKSGSAALHYANEKGRVGVVETLLRSGALVDVKNNRGRTSLLDAAYWGHKTNIELLLAAGADIKARSKKGSTVLHQSLYTHREDYKDHHACAFCAGSVTREDIVKLLCEKGADPSVKNHKGGTPLSLIRKGVSRSESRALRRVLKKYGAV